MNYDTNDLWHAESTVSAALLRWWISKSLQYQVKGKLELQKSFVGSYRIFYKGLQVDCDGRVGSVTIDGVLPLPPSCKWTIETKKLKTANAKARAILLTFPTKSFCGLYEKIQVTIPLSDDEAHNNNAKLFASTLENATAH